MRIYEECRELLQIAELVSDYLKLLYEHAPPTTKKTPLAGFRHEMFCR